MFCIVNFYPRKIGRSSLSGNFLLVLQSLNDMIFVPPNQVFAFFGSCSNPYDILISVGLDTSFLSQLLPPNLQLSTSMYRNINFSLQGLRIYCTNVHPRFSSIVCNSGDVLVNAVLNQRKRNREIEKRRLNAQEWTGCNNLKIYITMQQEDKNDYNESNV